MTPNWSGPGTRWSSGPCVRSPNIETISWMVCTAPLLHLSPPVVLPLNNLSVLQEAKDSSHFQRPGVRIVLGPWPWRVKCICSYESMCDSYVYVHRMRVEMFGTAQHWEHTILPYQYCTLMKKTIGIYCEGFYPEAHDGDRYIMMFAYKTHNFCPQLRFRKTVVNHGPLARMSQLGFVIMLNVHKQGCEMNKCLPQMPSRNWKIANNNNNNTNQHEPTRTKTNQHEPTRTNTNQHQPTPTNTNQHQPTPTNTNQHQPTPTNTNQPTNQPTNPPTDQPTNQPTNKSAEHSCVWPSDHLTLSSDHPSKKEEP